MITGGDEVSNQERIWILSLNKSESELRAHNDRLLVEGQ
ncbi:hypothetical protein LEP1GSC043_3097 [Leptospira weilii str. Ecochallenge]|uniref:Uncharacterized protein n=1 Tax=Leptospira weilii str. Ecochallenge TaxID=1049986 RepID=N1U2J6_9LEPT|nr:hypothetical protein LEP1GSC043_3097 [Leptospira weilii str. Ecochallenge]